MKIKTSVTLSEELLAEIDAIMPEGQNRSTFLEMAAMEHIARLNRLKQNQNDLEIINKNVVTLNEEALDVLNYQINPIDHNE
ncbi:MAG: ribbon-helix-helix domain-containing protein [Chloroflexota bacterium]